MNRTAGEDVETAEKAHLLGPARKQNIEAALFIGA
jgi:hypothetical protein